MTRKSKAAEFVQEGLNINVIGKNLHVTDAMEDYAVEKFSKIERLSNRIVEVNIFMDVQKLDHRVDIVMKVDHIVIKSHAITTDMYASIDMAIDKLESQLIKYKRRIQNHQGKNISQIDMTVNVIQPHQEDALDELNDEIEDETHRQLIGRYSPHKIVCQDLLPLKTLSFDEAVLKMELSGDAFLLFKGEEDRKLKLIYRRKDGHFGVIEPECTA